MTRLAAARILAEDSKDLMGGFGSKSKVDRVGLLDAKKDDNGGSVTADVNNDFVSTSEIFSGGVGGTNAMDSGLDGRGVFGGAFNGMVARDGKVSDGDFSCRENDGDRRKESARIINLNADVNRDGMGLGLGLRRWNGERLEDQNHGFRVGDFVWGKIKSHPWWPGQVYDPRNASEFALKHSQEGRVLVAFFGDGSCSWCLPSQLIPFVENLEEMSSESSSKSFQTAVQMAVDEIGRVVESRIQCRCIPQERRDHLARPKASNAGVREGVLVPEVGIDLLPLPEYEAAEILAKVADIARSGSFDSLFELAVLRSWVSAYYYGKCGSQLQVYSEPCLIEGLEDRQTAVTGPSQGPKEDVGLSSPNGSTAKVLSDEKFYHRRKQRSVSELMEKRRSVKSKNLKKMDAEEGKNDGQGVSSTGKRSRMRRDDDTLVLKSNETEVAPAGNTCVEAKDESDFESIPRERKKSKYLSPPYTNLLGRNGVTSYKLEAECDELMENTTGASHDLSASPVSEPEPVSEMDDKTSFGKKMSFYVSDVDVDVNVLLQKLQCAAVDCYYLRKEGHLDSVWGFISAHRSSTYLRGSDYRVYHKCSRVNKRKSLRSPSSSKPRGAAEEPDSSKSTDDLISGARVMRQKLEIMAATLESYCSRLSSDDVSCLKKEMEHLMENVEATGDKVRAMAEKHHTSS